MDDRLKRLIAGFERDGVEVVRHKLSLKVHYSPLDSGHAAEWVGRQDQERLERADASISEQMALTRESNVIASEAKEIAKKASKLAMPTLIVAIISAIAAMIAALPVIIGWLHG